MYIAHHQVFLVALAYPVSPELLGFQLNLERPELLEPLGFLVTLAHLEFLEYHLDQYIQIYLVYLEFPACLGFPVIERTQVLEHPALLALLEHLECLERLEYLEPRVDH